MERSGRPGNTFLGDVRVNFALAVFALLMFSSVFGDVGELALGRSGFGDVGYVTFIVPAVLVQVSMASALSSGIGLVDDLETGMFEKGSSRR